MDWVEVQIWSGPVCDSTTSAASAPPLVTLSFPHCAAGITMALIFDRYECGIGEFV